ncbi:hypothetical protein Nepgr_031446 [Nepenthes gracilis]|uniref:glutathione transferase n=1 Tax=Nepenthes gracilis TaxID=150966 RepID=A0AAD3TIG3_NEPGR|nr:hypothetical protein Nepgr_031446 [Nepenthes gracilis]
MAVKLYGLAMATCTATTLACLHEKEVEFEFINVDLFGGENKQPAFLLKNPFGQAPAFEDGDLTLFGKLCSFYMIVSYFMHDMQLKKHMVNYEIN